MKRDKKYILLGIRYICDDLLVWVYGALVYVLMIGILLSMYGIMIFFDGRLAFLPDWCTTLAYICSALFLIFVTCILFYWSYRVIKATPSWLEEKGRKYEDPVGYKGARNRERE